MTTVLLLGSGPAAIGARSWRRDGFDTIVAINNAHAIRPDWDALVYPYDFPRENIPAPRAGQSLIDETHFVPAQNRFGGFIYAGATMAFTAAYWALDALKPRVLAFYGCDMVYPATGPTHFYGTGAPDPLRADISLRSLEAKSARLMVLAAMQGCAAVNLSRAPSRLIFPRAHRCDFARLQPARFDAGLAQMALQREAALDYKTPSGHFAQMGYDLDALDAIDTLWTAAALDRAQVAA
ncbi:MAG: hypothetical protein U5N55_09615 [Cypionkella sp.]|nr:hypothetical protein [Cypionkella sp.]